MERKAQNNSILAHFLSIGAGTIVNMLLGLITTPIITRVVNPTEYGQMSIFAMYANIGLMVLCLGLDQSLVRFYYEKEDINYKKGLLRLCIFPPTVIAIVVSFFLIIFSRSFPELFEFDTGIITWLCVYTIILIWNRIALLVLRVSYQSKKYAFSNILHRIVYIIVAIFLLTTINSDYFVLLIIANLLSMLIPTIYAIVSNREIWRFGDSYPVENKKEIIVFGLPFIISMGLTTLFQACDKIALNKYCSYSDVGIYSSAMTLVTIFAIIQTSFNALWAPMQMEHYVKNPTDTSFIRKGNQCMTVILFVFGASLILGKDVFALMLGEKYREAAYILPFLAFNPIMYTLSETTQGGIDFSKKSYVHVIIAAVACVTNIIGNTILVPMLGCKGAAISTGLSYIVFFLCRTVISKKLYPVNYQLWKLCILTMVTIVYAFYNTFFEFSWITILLYVVIIATVIILYKKVICFIINYLLKFLLKKA